MKTVMTVAVIAAAALSTTAALAESTAFEQREKLNNYFNKTPTPAVSAQVSTTRDTSAKGALEGFSFSADNNGRDHRKLFSSQPHPTGR